MPASLLPFQVMFLVLMGLAAVVSSSSGKIPLQGQFTGPQAKYLHRVTTLDDWHPSQLLYEDGGVEMSFSSLQRPQLDIVNDDKNSISTTRVSPVDFGGDPFGIKDSSEAFREAIEALRRLCKHEDPSDVSRRKLPSDAPRHVRRNCGGAVLDLRGGWYAVSEPVRIPAGMGNLWIKGGTIFASEDFSPAADDPNESFVLIFGHNCTSDWQERGACTSNIGVQQLTLDAKKRAGGCLYLDHTSEATVGPGIMILGFSTFGITAFGSGGTILQGVFAGEFPNHDNRAHEYQQLNGTAINFFTPQHDGYITNSIIWSAKVGVISHGTGQHIVGVHPWNFVTDPEDGHQTSDIDGIGLGMVVTGAGARIEDCYLDTVPLILNMTGYGPVLISGNVFSRNSSVVLSAPHGQQVVRELVITNNIFKCKYHISLFGSCEREAVLLSDDTEFTTVEDTRVEGNTVDHDAGYRSTRARKNVKVWNREAATIDFSQDLLFPSAALANGGASCSLLNGEPVAYSIMHLINEPLKLRVKFASNWTGQLECTVDQSRATRVAL